MSAQIYVGAHEPTVFEEPEREDHSCDGCGSDDCSGECFERPPFSLDPALASLDSLESYSRLRSAKPSRAALLESVDDWAVNAEEALADIRSDAQRGLVGMKLPLAKLKSAVEQIEKRMRESEAAE